MFSRNHYFFMFLYLFYNEDTYDVELKKAEICGRLVQDNGIAY